MKYFIGIDLGGTNVRTLLVDENGTTYSEVKDNTERDNGPDYVCTKIIRQIESLDTTVCGGMKGVSGIGIGVPGPVDTVKGAMIMATNLPGFENYPTCYYVTVSTGIGGAFIVDGKLVSGGRGHAGEIGNIIVKNNGYKFGTLNPGAVEGEASGTAITRKGKELLGEDIVNHAGDVFRLADEGDLKAQSIVEECISQLATLFANIAHTVDPHCFIIGGGVMKSKDYFYDKLVEQFNSKIHVGMQGHIPLLTTKLEDCGAIGAAMLPMSRLK